MLGGVGQGGQRQGRWRCGRRGRGCKEAGLRHTVGAASKLGVALVAEQVEMRRDRVLQKHTGQKMK